MSDDLVKRLRMFKGPIGAEAADRIEALEAALTKADALADAVINERDADTTQSLIILGRAHYDYRTAREAAK